MMKRKSQTVGVLLALAAIVALTGCQAKDMQITELQRQVDDLSAANADLEARLADALSSADRSAQTALSLQSQLDDARRQLADARRQLAAAQTGGMARGSEMPAGWEGTEGFRWTGVGTDILFDSGKASLKKDGESALAEIIRTIQSQWPGKKIFIIGHTDNDPIMKTKNLWEDNLDLSANRAMTVAREFYKQGVDKKLVHAAGQGEYNPEAPNDNSANKKLNRRVVIAVVN